MQESPRIEASYLTVSIRSGARDEERDIGRPFFISVAEERPHMRGLRPHHRQIDRQEKYHQPQSQPQTSSADRAPGGHQKAAEVERIACESVRAAHRQLGVLPQMA